MIYTRFHPKMSPRFWMSSSTCLRRRTLTLSISSTGKVPAPSAVMYGVFWHATPVYVPFMMLLGNLAAGGPRWWSWSHIRVKMKKTPNLELIQDEATNASPGCEIWDMRCGMEDRKRVGGKSHISHLKSHIAIFEFLTELQRTT